MAGGGSTTQSLAAHAPVGSRSRRCCSATLTGKSRLMIQRFDSLQLPHQNPGLGQPAVGVEHMVAQGQGSGEQHGSIISCKTLARQGLVRTNMVSAPARCRRSLSAVRLT